MSTKISSLLALIVAGLLLAGQAQAITLPPPGPYNTMQYGDFYSYALPLIGISVPSTGDNISSLPIVATGADGKPMTTNSTGMDNAYATPTSTGQGTTFSTVGGASLSFTTQGNKTISQGITGGGLANTWDINLGTLTAFLDGQALLFNFNNNQENSTNAQGESNQDLFAIGQIQIRDVNGSLPTLYFDFRSTTNNNLGILGANNVYSYNNTTGDWSGANWTAPAGDWVRAFGEVNGVNLNLGANEVAYALTSPELNKFLFDWDKGLNGTSGYDIMSVFLAMNNLNGGYEQVFLTGGQIASTPEPGTMLLMGIGAVGAAFMRRRRMQ